MRNVLYINRESSLATIGSCVQAGDLVVVPDEEAAESLRGCLRWFGHETLRDLVGEDPLVGVDEARARSVEVRTLREAEAAAFNEKQAMEVL